MLFQEKRHPLPRIQQRNNAEYLPLPCKIQCQPEFIIAKKQMLNYQEIQQEKKENMNPV